LAVHITNTLDPTMITRPLTRCRSMLCASPGYLEQYGVPRTAADLRQYRCIARAFGIGMLLTYYLGDELRSGS